MNAIRLRWLLPLALAATLGLAHAATPWSLDAITDPRETRQGVPVLAVTPGGSAERIGLRAGDRIQSINGHSFVGVGRPTTPLDQVLSDSNGRVEMAVAREGGLVQLSGTLAARAASTSAQCGFVTVLGPTPRNSEGIFPAEITTIDGRSTPLFGVNRHQVDAGPRVLIVAERIEGYRLSDREVRQRKLMQERVLAGAYKALVVDVAPDTTYHVGARLLPGKRDNASIRANTYWEPVVFKQTHTRCP